MLILIQTSLNSSNMTFNSHHGYCVNPSSQPAYYWVGPTVPSVNHGHWAYTTSRAFDKSQHSRVSNDYAQAIHEGSPQALHTLRSRVKFCDHVAWSYEVTQDIWKPFDQQSSRHNENRKRSSSDDSQSSNQSFDASVVGMRHLHTGIRFPAFTTPSAPPSEHWESPPPPQGQSLATVPLWVPNQLGHGLQAGLLPQGGFSPCGIKGPAEGTANCAAEDSTRPLNHCRSTRDGTDLYVMTGGGVPRTGTSTSGDGPRAGSTATGPLSEGEAGGQSSSKSGIDHQANSSWELVDRLMSIHGPTYRHIARRRSVSLPQAQTDQSGDIETQNNVQDNDNTMPSVLGQFPGIAGTEPREFSYHGQG